MSHLSITPEIVSISLQFNQRLVNYYFFVPECIGSRIGSDERPHDTRQLVRAPGTVED